MLQKCSLNLSGAEYAFLIMFSIFVWNVVCGRVFFLYKFQHRVFPYNWARHYPFSVSASLSISLLLIPVYANGNNVRGEVTQADIRCTNGIIHVVDTMLQFPFFTIADVMEHSAELSYVSTSSLYNIYVRTISRYCSYFLQCHIRFLWYTHNHSYHSIYLLLNIFSRFVLNLVYTCFLLIYFNIFGRLLIRLASLVCLLRMSRLLTKSEWPIGSSMWNNVLTFACTFRPFYNMLRSIDDFYTWSDSYNINQTIFVPSATFLASLSDFHRTYINSEPGLIRKVSSLFF